MKEDVSKYIKLRNGIYHFRKVVNGKYIRKSLKTDNHAEAILKAEQLLGIKRYVGSPTLV